MNNGKICISIASDSADELLSQFGQAEPVADVVELRLDGMITDEIKKVFANVKPTKPVLFTYRPSSQGGKAADDPNERAGFWMTLFTECEVERELMWFDNEMDFGTALKWPDGYISIRSFHDFGGIPAGLNTIYDGLASFNQIIKIAAMADDVSAAIPLWNLIERARSESKSIIPIAMGESGKWTRILGLAHGAFMTYAPLDAGAETAPGQISAADMIDVFRVKELDRETEVFGVVAGDASYSVSPWMQNAAFKAAGMNRVFVPLQVDDLDEFISRMVKPQTHEVELNFRGFSITNPHKQAIMRHLDEIDETAAKIGAVNTVKIEGEKLCGYNTDAPGFIAPLKEHFGDLKNASVSVVGAGGAARACIYALKQEGANVTLFARDVSKATVLAEEFGVKLKESQILNLRSEISECDILVNATPLGTKGEKQDKSIATAEQLKDVKLVYDLIYNPTDTLLIREAKAAGVRAIGGLEMLIAQGAEQFEIWAGESAPVEAMSTAVRKKLNL